MCDIRVIILNARESQRYTNGYNIKKLECEQTYDMYVPNGNWSHMSDYTLSYSKLSKSVQIPTGSLELRTLYDIHQNDHSYLRPCHHTKAVYAVLPFRVLPISVLTIHAEIICCVVLCRNREHLLIFFRSKILIRGVLGSNSRHTEGTDVTLKCITYKMILHN